MSRAHPAVLETLAAYREDPASVDPLVDPWVRRFKAVSDRALRRTVLREGLDNLDDASLIAALQRLDQRARAGEDDARWMVAELAVNPSVVAEIDYHRLSELYVAARDAGYRTVAARFLGNRRSPMAKRPVDNPHVDRTAGERTSAAKTRDRLVIDRLLHDRDPRVIHALLHNPRVVETDVVKVAAMRPTAPEVLEAGATHPRWSQNYRVRKSLAFNPCTPTPLARQILRTLMRQDLVAMRDSGLVSPDLRADVNLLLSE